jgi:hypothetical protein
LTPPCYQLRAAGNGGSFLLTNEAGNYVGSFLPRNAGQFATRARCWRLCEA